MESLGSLGNLGGVTSQGNQGSLEGLEGLEGVAGLEGLVGLGVLGAIAAAVWIVAALGAWFFRTRTAHSRRVGMMGEEQHQALVEALGQMNKAAISLLTSAEHRTKQFAEEIAEAFAAAGWQTQLEIRQGVFAPSTDIVLVIPVGQESAGSIRAFRGTKSQYNIIRAIEKAFSVSNLGYSRGWDEEGSEVKLLIGGQAVQ